MCPQASTPILTSPQVTLKLFRLSWCLSISTTVPNEVANGDYPLYLQGRTWAIKFVTNLIWEHG